MKGNSAISKGSALIKSCLGRNPCWEKLPIILWELPLLSFSKKLTIFKGGFQNLKISSNWINTSGARRSANCRRYIHIYSIVIKIKIVKLINMHIAPRNARSMDNSFENWDQGCYPHLRTNIMLMLLFWNDQLPHFTTRIRTNYSLKSLTFL